MRCANCGEINQPGDRFCFNCGTALTTQPSATPSQPRPGADPNPWTSAPERPGSIPPPAAPEFPDWRVSPEAGSAPVAPYPNQDHSPPRRRSRLLMITLGLLLGCILLCLGAFAYSLTPGGEEFFQDLGTAAADIATEAAQEAQNET